MKRALLVALAACGSESSKPAPAATGSAPPAAAITARLVGCSPALAAPEDPRESLLFGPDPASGYGRPRLDPATAPRIQLQTPTVDGDLGVDIVRRILRRHVNRFGYCFEKQLLSNPKLAGGVVETAFAIQTSGGVHSPRADGIDAEVAKCVRLALESVRFPAPRDGNQVQVTLQIRIDYTPPANAGDPLAPPAPRRRPLRVPREWTPFATAVAASPTVAKPVADAATTAVRARLAAIEPCFDGARGAVRAMLAFDASGRAAAIRAGGLGDSAIEHCIATALVGISVAPTTEPVEVACDLARGTDAAPLRVSPDAGYTLIEVTSRELRSRSSTRDIPPRGAPRTVTALGTTSSVLVVAEPDAPAHGLEHALWWAPAGTTLVAIKAAGGAPVFVGMGDSRAQRSIVTTKRLVQLHTDAGKLRACIPGVALPDTAPLLDARAMDRVLAAVVAACQQAPCEPTVVVGTTGDFVAKDLVATTSAARRAGFHALSIGGPACER